MSKHERPQPSANNETAELHKRTKKEWIEYAEVFKAEPYDMAGALFDGKEEELYSKEEVTQKLNAYWHRPVQGGNGL